MYLGRIVAIGMTRSGKAAAMYRVSSRSFPNREAVKIDNRVAIVPRAGFEDDLKRNPYISYNCVRMAREFAIATNGSQTDPIVEKVAMGYPLRDAIALGLLAMDYEKDNYNTPRIVAAVSRLAPVGYLGIIRKDALLVKEFELKPGEAHYLSTYECNAPCGPYAENNFSAETAEDAAKFVIDGGVFAGFEHPVTSAVAVANAEGFDLATRLA